MGDEDSEEIDFKKRTFIKALGASLGAMALGGISFENYITPTDRNVPVMKSYPVSVLVDGSGAPITASSIPGADQSSNSYPIMVFNYPLQDEPNILMRINGVTIPGGVGSEGNIVALSGICQHLGCVVPLLDYHTHNSIPFEAKLIGYNESNWPEYGLIFCKCHGSQYNPVNGPQNLYNSGPAPSPANHSLPQVTLYVDPDDDFVYALGMNPESAVIRTHLYEPGGEVHGSEVMDENLSNGTALPLYNGTTPLSITSKIKQPVYKSIVATSSNGPWPGLY